MNEDNKTFADVKDRLDEIVEEVSKEDISLDDALTLYEEAVKLGLSACNLSESDIFPAEIEAVDDNAGEHPGSTTEDVDPIVDAPYEAASVQIEAGDPEMDATVSDLQDDGIASEDAVM